jgi:hypothetical protein
MLTNRLGLPQAIVDAVTNDPYSRGDSDISVTQLIQPPYQRKLRLENEVVEDVVDRIWSLVGQVGHGIVERAYPQAYTDLCKLLTPAQVHEQYGVVAERRLYMEVNGWKVSGQFDVIEGDKLMDYKFTSVWSVLGDTKTEWVNQLNLLRLLAIRNGIDVRRLGIVAILRDWSKGKAMSADYPKHQIAPVDIPVWSEAQAEAYVMERVLAHQAANPPPCTDVERWKREDVYAVMKVGRKSAVKLHDTQAAADQHVIDIAESTVSVVKRPGAFGRCQDYCNVMHHCPMMKTEVGF